MPTARRGVALGIWGGISGLAVAMGPLVGGAIVTGISWHWIFWLNVPIGLALLPFILLRLEETRGRASKLDLPGLALGSSGLVGIVWALVRANDDGWTSAQIIAAFILGTGLLASFVAWELRAEHPMLPMRDRIRYDANHPVPQLRLPLRGLGPRHGAVLCTGRQRGPVVRSAR